MIMTHLLGKKIKRLTPIIVAIASFSCISLFLLKSLPGIQTIEIDMEIDHPDQLKIYYSNSKSFREEASSAPLHINQQRSTVKISLGNSYANLIRIDPGEQKGTAKIYQLKISSYFSPPLVLGPNEIADLFKANNGSTLIRAGNHVEVVSSNNDPYIICNKRLFPQRYLSSCVFAFIFSIVVTAVTFPLQSQTGTLPKQQRGPQSGQEKHDRLDALDGLRGLAAIMVIADHTCGWFRGLGATGVWIFFTLSGFLLARPFIHNSSFILSFNYMSGYFRRRFMRILPMYFAYILIVFIMSERFNLAFLHALFLEGDGHLWAIPQEMFFYLLFPCVVLFICFPLKRYPGVIPVFLFLIILAWNRFVGIDKIWLLGMDHIRLQLYFGVFLTGVLFSYVYSAYSVSIENGSGLKKIASRLATPAGLGILAFFFLISTGHIFGNANIYSQQYFGYYGFLAGFLVFCVLVAKGKILDKFLTLAPLKALGIVGLSLYLVHPLVKNIVQGFFVFYFDLKLKNLPLFLATLVCSYFLSTYTYTHIERPGFPGKSNNNSQ